MDATLSRTDLLSWTSNENDFFQTGSSATSSVGQKEADWCQRYERHHEKPGCSLTGQPAVFRSLNDSPAIAHVLKKEHTSILFVETVSEHQFGVFLLSAADWRLRAGIFWLTCCHTPRCAANWRITHPSSTEMRHLYFFFPFQTSQRRLSTSSEAICPFCSTQHFTGTHRAVQLVFHLESET